MSIDKQPIEVDEAEFLEALENKNHKEMLNAFRSVVGAIDKKNAMEKKEEEKLFSFLEKQNKSIQNLVDKIDLSIEKDESLPLRNTLESIFEKVVESNMEVVKVMNSKPIVDNFEVIQRTEFGYIEKVKVNYKNVK